MRAMTNPQQYRHAAVRHITASNGIKHKKNKAAAPFTMVFSRCFTSFSKSSMSFFVIFSLFVILQQASRDCLTQIYELLMKEKKKKKKINVCGGFLTFFVTL